MLKSSSGSAGVVVMVLLMGVLLALASLVSVIGLNPGGQAAVDSLLGTGNIGGIQAQLDQILARSPMSAVVPAISPLLMAIVAVVFASRGAAPQSAQAAPGEEAEAGPGPEVGALRLLALLQQEARFVDFISEDIDEYDDAQIGAAAREIHADCRKSIRSRLKLTRIYENEEGSELTVEDDFDPAEVRLTGNITGDPPFRGTLEHGGWRASDVTLPESPGNVDPSILAPAEVEIA